MKRVDYNYDALTDYERGYLDGVSAYAWWTNGVSYVGKPGRTLADVIERFLTDRKSPALR